MSAHSPVRLIGALAAFPLALLLLAGCAQDTDARAPIPESEWAGIEALATVAPGEPIDVRDGFIALGDGLDPFSEGLPALDRLDPALLSAVREAAAVASADGVPFLVNSGWRSPRYQQRLLDDAIRDYGSEAQARKLVSSPEKSRHVIGHAVDIGPTDGNSWLGIRGSRFGLCQIYANESWHFELATSPGGTCPDMLPDASGG